MKVFILTLGSHGDVQPYVALGKGLAAAGHEVSLCTSASFKPFIEQHGLKYQYMSNKLVALIDSPEARSVMEKSGSLIYRIKAMKTMVRETNLIYREILNDCWISAQAANPDVIIYHPKAFGAVHIAEKLDIQPILTLLQPLIVPSAELPAIGVPQISIGGWYNRFSYALVRLGYNRYTKMVNTFRRDTLRLKPFPANRGLLKSAAGLDIPVLHAFSRYLIPPPTDWPAHAYVSGNWFLENADNWHPSESLAAFLEGKESPIYVGFGSIAGRNPERTTRIFIEAFKQTGLRAVFATGWGGLSSESLPDNIFSIENAPHDKLFPLMKAVVHHGGAGTTAVGLKAGRPTLVCPFFGDQPFFGHRVHTMGLGPAPIPQTRLTVKKLSAALQQLATDHTLQQNAQTVAQQIKAENGIDNARQIIEDIVER